MAVEETVPPRRDRVRLAAILGALSSAVLVVAFFLPWIRIPADARPRVREAIEPGLENLEKTHPKIVFGYEVLLGEIEESGAVSGLDLFVYSRTARGLNEVLLGQPGDVVEPADEGLATRTRRAFLVAMVVLAGLPVAALLLFVHFVAHGFRRARSPTLILLTVAGFVGMAVALAWLRFANGLGVVKALTGEGLRATLAASVAQLGCGVFGVTNRNWWRVYVGSLATLLALGAFVWAHVWEGVTP
jgi:hypothetical protein